MTLTYDVKSYKLLTCSLYIPVYLGMSRLRLFWLIAFFLQMYCNRYSQAQDLAQIKSTIEKERQFELIKKRIFKELVKNGARIQPLETTGDEVTIDKEESKNEGQDRTGKSSVMVTLGKPASSINDNCLTFHLAKYIKDVDYIVPKKINLWIHLRKRENKKGKRKKTDKTTRAGALELRSKRRQKTDRKKGRKKNKKRRQGRRIKIFISDGVKTLVKMRMRVSKTSWYKIELPISQFPEIISVNDNFTLCFKCKRCSKKITMDLYKKDRRDFAEHNTTEEDPTIPFIHFEEPRSQTIYRYKRSIDEIKRSSYAINNKHRHGPTHNRKCCSEELYQEEITKVFPSILYPEFINISLCSANTDSTLDQPLLSQNISSHRHLSGMLCVPNKYETFNFVYVNTHFKMRYASIPDLIPVGCTCRQVT